MGEIHQTINIAASAEQVWQTIRNFHDVSWAPNVVTSVDVVGDKSGEETGAVRILNGVFYETLLSLDDAGRTFSYSIDNGPGPVAKEEVSDYVGVVRVREESDGDGAIVEWSSSWQDNDEAVGAFCTPIYQALLADMKNSLE